MQKSFCLIVLILISISVRATHLIGGDITYRYIKENSDFSVTYEIKLSLIRDVSSEVDFDQTARLGIYDSESLKLVDSAIMTDPVISSYNKRMCIPDLTDKFELAEYTQTVTLHANPHGYTITWERCCKTDFANVQNDQNGTPVQPFYLISEIPATNVVNSSAELPYMVQAFCEKSDARWSMSLFDRDGDSISIALAPLYVGRAAPSAGLALPPINLTMTTKTNMKYNMGYAFQYPFGFSVSPNISDNTIGFKVSNANVFNVGVLIKEYRNSELITSHTADMAAIIYTCQNQGDDKPAGLFLEQYDVMQPMLTWNICNNAIKHFEIWRSFKTEDNFTKIDTTDKLVSRYIDTTPTLGGRYFYKIVGIPEDGQTSGETATEYIDLFKTGIPEFGKLETLSVYPNPFRDELILRSDQQIEELFIVNQVGQHVFGVSPQNTQITIQPNLDPGMYVLSVRTSTGVEVIRLIREE